MPLKNLNDFKNEVIENENVIVGSGAGGSTVAYELLKKNKESIILEEGPSINGINKSNIGINIANLYKNNGATPIYSFNGGPLIGYGQGSCVGGSTYVNAGYFSGTPEWVYDEWLKEERLKTSYSEFQKLYEEIKSEINVSTESVTKLDGASEIMNFIANKKKFKIEKCERFSDGISGNEKNNMNSTYHKSLLKKNVQIIHDCKVIKILLKNNRAYMITVKDKKNGKKVNIKFKNLFICCGPISSPHLLMKNKLIYNQKNQNNFEFHINFKVLVKFKKDTNLNSNRSYDPDHPVSVYFMREYEKEGALLSSANSELPYMLATSSHFDEKIKRDIYQNFSKYCMYIYQIKSNSFGQVRDFFGNPFVDYKFDQKDTSLIKSAINRVSNFFLENDAEKIFFPIEGSTGICNLKDSNEISENLNVKKLHLVSVHGMSSLRSGKEENCHTTYSGKLKNYENIFINDASILPGNTGESPQASIMVMVKNNIKNLKL
jgi:choline dehydrogenase-like flavoprotein